jgi:hypothetical protein
MTCPLKNDRQASSTYATGSANAELSVDADSEKALAKPVAQFFNRT